MNRLRASDRASSPSAANRSPFSARTASESGVVVSAMSATKATASPRAQTGAPARRKSAIRRRASWSLRSRSTLAAPAGMTRPVNALAVFSPGWASTTKFISSPPSGRPVIKPFFGLIITVRYPARSADPAISVRSPASNPSTARTAMSPDAPRCVRSIRF